MVVSQLNEETTVPKQTIEDAQQQEAEEALERKASMQPGLYDVQVRGLGFETVAEYDGVDFHVLGLAGVQSPDRVAVVRDFE
jgi:hypothetical protein